MLVRNVADGAQVAIVLLALAAVQLAPPARGRMLLMPIAGKQSDAVRAARAADALVLGRGPLPGSAIVEGARGPLLSAASRGGMVLLAAPRGGCSERAL